MKLQELNEQELQETNGGFLFLGLGLGNLLGLGVTATETTVDADLSLNLSGLNGVLGNVSNLLKNLLGSL